jgi:hypothetical protein
MQAALFRQTNGRKIMQQTILTALALILVAATAQAAMASEHHYARAKERPAIYEQWRNSNAYAVPGDTSAQTEGAMTSGIAGH